MPPVTVRKKYGHTVSTLQGSNKVIACAKAEWNNIRSNSFIIVDGDKYFYSILDKKRFTYKKTCEVIENSKLKINENTSINLGIDDDVAFRYEEYKVNAAEIKNGGSDYTVGDILNPLGGIYRYNSIDNIDSPAEIKVTEVDDSGKVLSVQLVSSGAYSLPPHDECEAQAGSGQGATFSLTSSAAEIMSIEERSVIDIERNDDHTILYLNSSLPPRLQKGEIEVDKWELTLDKDYIAESKFNAGYDIIKDFTPNSQLPLLYGNIVSNHLLYNEAMSIIDKKLKAIEDKLDL
jgi:hypothetical protein